MLENKDFILKDYIVYSNKDKKNLYKSKDEYNQTRKRKTEIRNISLFKIIQ